MKKLFISDPILKSLTLSASTFAFALSSPLNGDVLVDFFLGQGSDAASGTVTVSDLTSPTGVSITESFGSIDPDSVENTVTSGVSGSLFLNFSSLSNFSSSFVADTWSGGSSEDGTLINTQANGWGVSRTGRANSRIQTGEALLVSFDLSSLNLGSTHELVLTGVDFESNDSRNGSLYFRDENVNIGDSNAGVLLAENVVSYIPVGDGLTISDGDTFALMRGSKDTFVRNLSFDIVAVAIPEPSHYVAVLGLIGSALVIRRQKNK